MADSNHALTSEFPQHFERIRTLYIEDRHFRQQSERYHQLDREITALENSGLPIGDQALYCLKMERVRLKDTLFRSFC